MNPGDTQHEETVLVYQRTVRALTADVNTAKGFLTEMLDFFIMYSNLPERVQDRKQAQRDALFEKVQNYLNQHKEL